MESDVNKAFGGLITRLIQKKNLTRNQAKEAFVMVLEDKPSTMQQGAFLAALTAKGETEDEVAGSWEAIYQLDTEKVTLETKAPLVDNSGTGMDTFKTYNISTAASLIAASSGVKMARHGARAITSVCGTVDIAEAIGVDVECSATLVARSIDKVGIGLFNGMSPEVHPNALGRILSQIHFGSTLNIAASLANPALPKRGVRGVYSKEMILPVARVMKAIGYEKAIVLHGSVNGSDKGMDEASVCGTTWCAELSEDGNIVEHQFSPETFSMGSHSPDELIPGDGIETESKRFISLLMGKETGARQEAAILNAGLIYVVAGMADSLEDGIKKAAEALSSGMAFDCLESWVTAQNRQPGRGLETLEKLK